MMRIGFILLAAAAAPAATLAQPPLRPLASFIGHCWAGEAPVKGGIDTHCFEAVYGGQHVRDRHVVSEGGKPVYWGETVYSAEGGKVSFTYWNSLGGLGRGAMSANGERLSFSGTVHGTPDARDATLAATWRKVDNGYEVRDSGSPNPRLFKRTD